jgi:23S rRNA (guanosine2251-2'-O)-methyltransferase
LNGATQRACCFFRLSAFHFAIQPISTGYFSLLSLNNKGPFIGKKALCANGRCDAFGLRTEQRGKGVDFFSRACYARGIYPPNQPTAMKPPHKTAAFPEQKRQPAKKNAKPAELPDDDSLLWGINAVAEALHANPRSLSEIFIEKGKAGARLQEIIDAAREAKVRCRFVDMERIGLPGGCRHQGAAARRSEAELLPLAELLAAEPERILLLDSIQDPRNLGSILRSALAAGFSSVVLTSERSAPLTGTAVHASAGAAAYLRLSRVVNLADALRQLKDQGYWIYGAVAEPEAQSIYQTDFRGRIGIVIGGEDKGIRPLVKKHCDFLVTVPMAGEFNSLNASVAAALVMFEAAREKAAV